ncbi:guanitoxin biosynthesis heme-dependent pre-guanitoxin N-hydroxylase GntA [Hoeflea alexandrii]|uniref:guanitoxin biosynthesis heme-dependent pre-guanitoxin N-hydroxylase GntA n=1 Tax=Hoeflea alexandrii TaxID=288436 RepID=UPI003CCD1CCF
MSAQSRRSHATPCRYCRYGQIDGATDDVEIHRALREYSDGLDHQSPIVRSFVVIFDGPDGLDEEAFEKALWNRLQSLHNLDVVSGQPWNQAVDHDPKSPHFSLSVGGEPFFVIGLHPNASRPARRFEKPALVFNSHLQFEKLRSDGRFDKMKEIIRNRDEALMRQHKPDAQRSWRSLGSPPVQRARRRTRMEMSICTQGNRLK